MGAGFGGGRFLLAVLLGQRGMGGSEPGNGNPVR
jgi:hypothetical protein